MGGRGEAPRPAAWLRASSPSIPAQPALHCPLDRDVLEHPPRTSAVRARRADPARLATLSGLLGDPSPTVWREVRRELRALGAAARPLLRTAARRGEPRARARARLMLLRAGRATVARRLVRFASRDEIDLERGLLLLSRFEQPRLDVRHSIAALDAMGAELADRTEALPPNIERAQELIRFLAEDLGYDGERDDYHHPDNVFLHRAIERKRGLPLTLTALYLCVARRAGISAAPVALPGHVVLRLHDRGGNVLVDPVRLGARLSERDCLAYLARRGLPFRPEWFADASDAHMLERQVRNLRQGYARRDLAAEARLLDMVLTAFERRRQRSALAGEAS